MQFVTISWRWSGSRRRGIIMQLIFKLLHYFSQDDLEIIFHGDGSDAKDNLQAEEAENTRKMEKKMFQKDGSMLWCYAAGTIHGKVHMLPIWRFLTLQIKINIPKQKWQG